MLYSVQNDGVRAMRNIWAIVILTIHLFCIGRQTLPIE
jgi:hypothetical protein